MIGEAKIDGRVAAFFDLDGTLIPEPSLERRLFAALRKNNRIPAINYLRWLAEALRLLPKGPSAVQHSNKRYLTGISSDLVFRSTESMAFFEEGIARVVWHAQQGHQIVLLSGTLEALARFATAALECQLAARGIQIHPRVCATGLAEDRGRWTGYLAGEAIYGPAKVRALELIAKQEGLDLRECHAYADSLLDRQVLCAVGYAHAVNPGKELAVLAKEKNWLIWHWHLEKQIAAQENAKFTKEIHYIEGHA